MSSVTAFSDMMIDEASRFFKINNSYDYSFLNSWKLETENGLLNFFYINGALFVF